MRRVGVVRLLAAAAIVLTGVAAWVAAAPAVGAHALLEETSPAADEVVATSPGEIRLRFDEAVQLPERAVRLLDTDGAEVGLGAVSVVDATVTARVDDRLADGTYVVAWKVVSADSHPISGAYTFSVGRPSAGSTADAVAAAGPEGTPVGPQAALDVTAALAYGGALVAVGAAWFLVMIVGAAGPDGGGSPSAIVRLVRVAALVAGLGLVAGVATAAARLDGAWPTWMSLRDEATGGPGQQAVVGLVGLALVVAALGSRAERAGRRATAVVLVAGAITVGAGFVIVGHTRTATPVAVVSAVDVVHLAAGAVWTGGLAALVVFLAGRRGGDHEHLAAVVGRFSGHAALSLVAVTAAGVTLAWSIVGSWSDLTSTTYGRLLILKVVVVAALAALGAYNRWRLVGRLDDGPGAVATLRRTVRVEVGVAAVVVALTATFTALSPEPQPTPDAGAATAAPLTCEEAAAMESMPGMEGMDHSCVGTTTSSVAPGASAAGATTTTVPGVQRSAAFGDGQVTVVLSPGTAGTNTVTVVLTTATGAPLDVAQAPTVRFRLRARDLGPFSAPVTQYGSGTYRARQDLALAGEWEVEVSAVVSDFEQPTAVVTFDVR